MVRDEKRDDEYLLSDPQKIKELSIEEILALNEGMLNASDLEDGLKLKKGTLRKFTQAQESHGVDTYKEYGIGRVSLSNRYLVRLSTFTRMWDTISEKIKELGLTRVRFKVPAEGSNIWDLIEEGGIFKLSRLEGKMMFKVRALKHRYYELLAAGKDPRKELGLYKDGKLFLVDMERFGAWYRRQKVK